MKISIVVPCYNELNTLPELFSRLAALTLDKEVIAVDDGSTDGSRRWLEEALESGRFPFEFKLLRHEANRGKGRALITGFSAVSGDVVIVQDADLEYDCRYIPEVVRPICEGRADAVYGSRLISGGSQLYSRLYLFGNMFLTFLINRLFGSRMTDSYTCYKAFSARCLRSLALSSDGFEIEAEISCKLAFNRARLEEVPIVSLSRSRKEGKKINYRDAFRGVLKILLLRATLGGNNA